MEELSERLGSLIAKGYAVPKLPEGQQYVMGPVRYEPDAFSEWRSQSLALLRANLPHDHTYVEQFAEGVDAPEHDQLRAGIGILTALKEDVDGGYLSELRSIISAEVFTDFLEIAAHLLENGYHHAAASVAGAVLEDALRRELRRRQLKAGSNLESLNQVCLDNDLYPALAYKQVKVWIEVRNHADHGEFEQVDSLVVESMIRDLPIFLRRDVGLP